MGSDSESNELKQALSNDEEPFDPVEYKACKKKIFILSITFMLLFSAFNSFQNLVTTLFSDYNNLGIYSLMLLYIVFAFSSLFANEVISRFDYKVIFVFSSLGYVSYIAAGILVSLCDGTSDSGICSETVIYIVVLFCAGLCGYSASLIWIAQGGYLSSVAQKVPSKKGSLSGIFWSIMQGSQIVGNILGTFILNLLSNTVYFFIMTGLGITASLLFLLLPSVDKIKVDQSNKIPLKTQIKNVFKLMVHDRTRYAIPFMMLSGIIVSFYSGFLHNLVKTSLGEDASSDEVSKKLSYTLICLGCFETISGIVTGKISDKVSVYKMMNVATMISMIGILFSFLGIFTENYMVCFIIASTWGFCDCFFNSVFSTYANKDFAKEIEIFQVFRFTISLTNAFFYIINTLLKHSPNYIFCLITMACIIFTSFTSTFLDRKQKKETSINGDSSQIS